MFNKFKKINYYSLDKIENVRFQTLLEYLKENKNNKFEQTVQEHPIASNISTRNSKNVYRLPYEDKHTFINFIGQKTIIDNDKTKYLIDRKFTFFEPESFSQELPSPVVLKDGTVFRVIGQGVKSPEMYDYKIVDDGIVKNIPNFATVKVLLAERNQTLDNISILEESEFKDVLRESDKNKLIKSGFSPSEATDIVNDLALGIVPDVDLPEDFSADSFDSSSSDNNSESSDGVGGIGGPGGGPGSENTGGTDSSSDGTGGSSGTGTGGGSGGSGTGGGSGGSGGTGTGGGTGGSGGTGSDEDGTGIDSSFDFEDRSDEMTPEIDQLTSFSSQFLELAESTASQCQTLDTFQSNVDSQVEVLNNEIQSKTAENEALKAESEAAIAEADARKAEADAKKAEYEFLISQIE